MKLAGFLLLMAGWAIVIMAVALFSGTLLRAGFSLAGMGVELLGSILVVRAHLQNRGGSA